MKITVMPLDEMLALRTSVSDGRKIASPAKFVACANCGGEVPPGEGAELRVSFRDKSRLKRGVLCEACAGRMPGATTTSRGAARVATSHDKTVESALSTLPERHRRALHWFAARAGQEIRWPQPLAGGTFLACRPKGIYKPAWSKYALSVRESLNRGYPDEEPIVERDGSWTYRYFQENLSSDARDREFTNVGLLACIEDLVPVGVFRQVMAKPNARYRVLGVAIVHDWRDGFFELASVELAKEGIA